MEKEAGKTTDRDRRDTKSERLRAKELRELGRY
jgi:hypothetical protein